MKADELKRLSGKKKIPLGIIYKGPLLSEVPDFDNVRLEIEQLLLSQLR